MAVCKAYQNLEFLGIFQCLIKVLKFLFYFPQGTIQGRVSFPVRITSFTDIPLGYLLYEASNTKIPRNFYIERFSPFYLNICPQFHYFIYKAV